MSAADKNPHYYKTIPLGAKTIDVYRVLKMFNVTDPCLQHAIKKLLVAGGRGAGKDIAQDVQEAAQSLCRYFEMSAEEIRQESQPQMPIQYDWIIWSPKSGVDQPVFKDGQWIRVKLRNNSVSAPLVGNSDAVDWSFDLGEFTVVEYCLLEGDHG